MVRVCKKAELEIDPVVRNYVDGRIDSFRREFNQGMRAFGEARDTCLQIGREQTGIKAKLANLVKSCSAVEKLADFVFEILDKAGMVPEE